MTDPDLRDDGKTTPGIWRQIHRRRWDSSTIPDDGEIRKDISRSRSMKWGPRQRGQQGASRAYFPGQPRPQRQEKDFYLHHLGMA